MCKLTFRLLLCPLLCLYICIDDARLHNSPTYVHCRAGKSRSVTAVLAYLMRYYRWPLKTAYAYVLERRNRISPNIGFITELIAFEVSELGRSSPILGIGSEGGGGCVQGERNGDGKLSLMELSTDRVRERLSPVWTVSESVLRGDKGTDGRAITDLIKNEELRASMVDMCS